MAVTAQLDERREYCCVAGVVISRSAMVLSDKFRRSRITLRFRDELNVTYRSNHLASHFSLAIVIQTRP